MRVTARLREERGVVEIIVAVSMVMLLVVTALMVDVGNGRQTQRNLQAAADSGAMAGAPELPGYSGTCSGGSNGSDPTWCATDYAFDTLHVTRAAPSPTPGPCTGSSCTYQAGTDPQVTVVETDCSQTSCPVTPADSGGAGYVSPAWEITVTVCQTVNTTFARVINVTSFHPCESATAAIRKPANFALFSHSANCGQSDQDSLKNGSDSKNNHVMGYVRSNGDILVAGNNFHVNGGTSYGGTNHCPLTDTGNGNTFIPAPTTDFTQWEYPADYRKVYSNICPAPVSTQAITIGSSTGSNLSGIHCTTNTITVTGNNNYCTTGCTFVGKTVTITGNGNTFSPAYKGFAVDSNGLLIFATGPDGSSGCHTNGSGCAVDIAGNSNNGAAHVGSLTGTIFAPGSFDSSGDPINPDATINLEKNNAGTVFLEAEFLLLQGNNTLTGSGPPEPGTGPQLVG